MKSSEATLAYQREYRKNNPEKCAATGKAWQQKNKEAHNRSVAKYYQANKDIAIKAGNKYTQANQGTLRWTQRAMVNKSRGRAKSKGLAHNVTLEYIQSIWPIDNKCPIFGTEFTFTVGNMNTCASLDRIDNAVGYVIGNVAVISWRANSLKSCATIAEIEAVIKYIEENTK